MVNIQDLFDDAKCYQTIREMRWPDGVTCPRCSSDSVIKNGRDDTEMHRQRYECRGCRQRFDDLTDTVFAGHHLPLRTWIACLYRMGLNRSGLQIASELDINKDDARAMIQQCTRPADHGLGGWSERPAHWAAVSQRIVSGTYRRGFFCSVVPRHGSITWRRCQSVHQTELDGIRTLRSTSHGP